MSSWMKVFFLALIALSGWLVRVSQACDMQAAFDCVEKAKISLQSPDTPDGDRLAICRMNADMVSEMDACEDRNLNGCDFESIANVNHASEMIRNSANLLKDYCKPGCEDYVEHREAYDACVRQKPSGPTSPLSDHRSFCIALQDMVNCILHEVKTCTDLYNEARKMIWPDIGAANEMYGCTVKEEGQLIENGTECMDPMYSGVLKCFHLSMVEFGLDVMAGPAGGFNGKAIHDFPLPQEDPIYKHWAAQGEVCQKVNQETFLNGTKCLQALHDDSCPEVGGQFSAMAQSLKSICLPGCEDYWNRIQNARACAVHNEASSVTQSTSGTGACRWANETTTCFFSSGKDCPLFIDLFNQMHIFASEEYTALVEDCNIPVQSLLDGLKPEDTSNSGQRAKTTPATAGATGPASLKIILELPFALMVGLHLLY